MLLKEASDLYQALDQNFFKDLKGAKFNYAMVRNKSILKSELALVESAFKASEKYFQYDSKRVDLLKKYAEKDEKGNPVIESNNFKLLPEEEKKFLDELNVVKEEFADALKEREKQSQEFNKLLDEPISFELHMISLDIIPDEVTKEQMEILMPLIR
jgi:hypothetical protein